MCIRVMPCSGTGVRTDYTENVAAPQGLGFVLLASMPASAATTL
jgi:hypothetical protein